MPSTLPLPGYPSSDVSPGREDLAKIIEPFRAYPTRSVIIRGMMADEKHPIDGGIDEDPSCYSDYYTETDATSYFYSEVPPTYAAQTNHSHSRYFWVGPNRKGPR